jgi:flavin prenyltransferase
MRIVIGITGASGAAYALRVIHLLVAQGVEVHLAASALGRRLLSDELGIRKLDPASLLRAGEPSKGGAAAASRRRRPERGSLTIHSDNDLGSPLASGSFLHEGMIVVPCSSNTLGAIAAGVTQSLVQRAAMVTLKERRKLILAHRESPLTHIDILNMQRLSEAGAIIAPLSPGFYMLPRTVEDVVDFMAGKLLDLVGVPHELNTRWRA